MRHEVAVCASGIQQQTVRSQGLKAWTGSFRVFTPGIGLGHGFQKGDAAHRAWMTASPIKSQSRTSVMPNQGDVLPGIQLRMDGKSGWVR